MASPSKKVKRLYEIACKSDSSVRDLPLKLFAKGIRKDFPVVDEWFENKSGMTQRIAKEKREQHKGARIRAEKQATKAAKQKKK